MKLQQLLETIHESLETSTPEEIVSACRLIARTQAMTGGERDIIHCAFFHGPIPDGDVPSKTARDQLILDGLMVKVVVKTHDGFNALNYRGFQAYKILQAERNEL